MKCGAGKSVVISEIALNRNIGCIEIKYKKQGIKKLYHKLPMCRKAAIKADINNGFIIKKENLDGMKKFGESEKLVYLEKEL